MKSWLRHWTTQVARDTPKAVQKPHTNEAELNILHYRLHIDESAVQ